MVHVLLCARCGGTGSRTFQVRVYIPVVTLHILLPHEGGVWKDGLERGRGVSSCAKQKGKEVKK